MKLLQIILMASVLFVTGCSQALFSPKYKEEGPVTSRRIIKTPKTRTIITISRVKGKYIITKHSKEKI